MATDTTRKGYVLTDAGEILVQLPADNQWGFVLADDDSRISDDDRERLGWLLDEAE